MLVWFRITADAFWFCQMWSLFLFLISLLFCTIFEISGIEMIWNQKSSTIHSLAYFSLSFAPTTAPKFFL